MATRTFHRVVFVIDGITLPVGIIDITPSDQASAARALKCPCRFITMPLGLCLPVSSLLVKDSCGCGCYPWHLLVVHGLGRRLEDYLCFLVTL